MDKIESCLFRSEPFFCDNSGRILISRLCEDLLTVAEKHADDRGFGMKMLNESRRTWVLSRLAIEIKSMPMQYESFTIETWIEAVRSLFTHRNFRISTVDGHTLGFARSIWAMINLDNRKPEDIPSLDNGSITTYALPEKECLMAPIFRLKSCAKDEPLRVVSIQYTDIDANKHVNSIKYLDYILNLFEPQWHIHHSIKRFDIAYVREAYWGDLLRYYMKESSPLHYDISVIKEGNSENDENEVCRCHIEFAEI